MYDIRGWLGREYVTWKVACIRWRISWTHINVTGLGWGWMRWVFGRVCIVIWYTSRRLTIWGEIVPFRAVSGRQCGRFWVIEAAGLPYRCRDKFFRTICVIDLRVCTNITRNRKQVDCTKQTKDLDITKTHEVSTLKFLTEHLITAKAKGMTLNSYFISVSTSWSVPAWRNSKSRSWTTGGGSSGRRSTLAYLLEVRRIIWVFKNDILSPEICLLYFMQFHTNNFVGKLACWKEGMLAHRKPFISLIALKHRRCWYWRAVWIWSVLYGVGNLILYRCDLRLPGWRFKMMVGIHSGRKKIFEARRKNKHLGECVNLTREYRVLKSPPRRKYKQAHFSWRRWKLGMR